MMKKLLICGLVFFSILFASTLCVSAADEKKTFTDDQNDVVDMDNVTTSQKPNIDIVQIDYSKTGTAVTLTLHVKGNIENRGDINDSESLNFVFYELVLYTTETYGISYMNKTAILFVNDENGSVSFNVDGPALTLNFDLISADETYDGLYASTVDASGMQIYVDEYEDVPVEIIVDAGGPYSGGVVGQSIKFAGSASGGTEPYTWAWDFDGATSDEQNPTHSYDEAGTYEVTLYVTDGNDNEGSDSLTVTISDGEQESSNSGLILFVVIIAIIAIAGIAVVVYIIRR